MQDAFLLFCFCLRHVGQCQSLFLRDDPIVPSDLFSFRGSNVCATTRGIYLTRIFFPSTNGLSTLMNALGKNFYSVGIANLWKNKSFVRCNAKLSRIV